MLNAASQAGGHRRRGADPLRSAGASLPSFLAKTGLPYATMMLGKTVLDESHPQFIGLYQGDRSRDYVRERIENADCVLELGALPTDFNTGGFTVKLLEDRTISANYPLGPDQAAHLSGRHAPRVHPGADRAAPPMGSGDPGHQAGHRRLHAPAHDRASSREPDRPLTIRRFFDRIGHFLEPGAVVIAETGVALFSAAETLMPEGAKFIGQTFYGSIGYTVGATLGASLAAADRQVVLFVGDGSFQVTCQDLSTLIRLRPEADRLPAEQRRLHDRARDRRSALQRHPALEIPSARRGLRRRPRVRRPHRGRARGRPRPGRPAPTNWSSSRSTPSGSTARNRCAGPARPWPGRTSWNDQKSREIPLEISRWFGWNLSRSIRGTTLEIGPSLPPTSPTKLDRIMRGVLNIVIGGVFIVGGLTGNMSLRGTSSGPALAAVGALLVGIGIFRLVKSR